MNQFKIVYIDDQINPELSAYLDGLNGKEIFDYKIDYHDEQFHEGDGYIKLIDNPTIKEANYLLIDSCLFENNTVQHIKFTGEEMSIILQSIFPFIWISIITQNVADDASLLHKFDSLQIVGETYSEYYQRTLLPDIKSAIKKYSTLKSREEKLQTNSNWNKFLRDKVDSMFYGINEYSDLRKEDIDQLVLTFNKLIRKYEKE